MIFFLNAPILTGYGRWQFDGPISVSTAREKLNNQETTSVIGHAATAELLSKLLQRNILVNRIAVTLQPGDCALVFRLTQRQPEGRVLNGDDLTKIPHELGWLQYLIAESPESPGLQH